MILFLHKYIFNQMKHFSATALLCGAAILGASAQNIVITDKDGLAHRFKADYVKEITFEKIQPQGDEFNLNITSVEVNPWSTVNIQVVLNGENGDLVKADLYQPQNLWLTAGNYVVDGSYQPYTFDPGWSSVVIGGVEKTPKSGALDIKLEGDVYTFTLDITTEDGLNVKGSYTGKTTGFGPVVNYDLTGASYAEVNDPAPNGFYYNFNDEYWKLEMRLELFSEGNAPKAGVYTFSTSTDNGNAGSYVHLYSPYNEVTEFSEGTVTVAEDGSVKINGKLANGLTMNAEYARQLPARPSSAQECKISSVDLEVWSLTNVDVIFGCENGDKLTIDIFQPKTMWLCPGHYVMDDSFPDFSIDAAWSEVFIGGEKKEIETATLDINLDGEVYTFDVEVTTTDGETVKGTYTSTLKVFGPSIDFSLSGVSYANVNDPLPNGFYYNFNDENWKLEMRIELFSDGDAPAAGSYTFSTSTDNGCAGSYVHLYSPYNDVMQFSEGTVTVEKDGDNTKVTIDGTLTTGLKMTASFDGKLPERTAE